MKLRTLFAGSLSVLLLAGWSAQGAEMTRFAARSGSKMRIDGTANMIHTKWSVQSTLVGGYIEAGPGFPTEPGQAEKPGKVEAKVESFVPVRSLKSIENDGSHYSDHMDDIMYEKIKAQAHPRITYRMTELVLKEPAKSKDAPYIFDSKGELQVAGVTNAVSMPVEVYLLGDKKMKVTGSTTLKMSSFKVEAPTVNLVLGELKTGDDVKISFEWTLLERPAPASAAR